MRDNTAAERLHFLDGLRGWGALAVVLYHVFVEAFPINPEAAAKLWRVFMFNGTLAVWVFFLVSGFSLSIGFCRTRDSASLAKVALGRYVRLAVPVLCAVMILYLFFAFGLVLPPERRLPIFQTFMPAAPSFLEAFRFALFDTFFAYNSNTTLIGPLWTMPFELWGSCLVLGTLFVIGRLERRFYVYVALGVVAYLIHPIYSAFMVGMGLAELYVFNGQAHSHQWSRGAPLVLVLLAVASASLLPQILANASWAYLVVGTALTAGCMFSQPVSAFLSGRLSRFLGRISFPLYLIHGPLLLVYSNAAYRWVGQPTDLQKVALNCSTVIVSVLCAVLIAPIDRWGIAAAKHVSSFVVGRRRDVVPA